MTDKTTAERAAICDTLLPLLEAMFVEFQEASKKKPDAVLSPKKVEIANRVLEKVKIVLVAEASNEYVDTLDDVNLPQNGDATLILGQANAALGAYHEKYYYYESYAGKKFWHVQE